ncbi:MAG TPA: hypothetical protein H9759_06980 [Candidatus Dietzia intestinipullorum]|nr:hypothetical protein [Candidatus Dietzia intestinipullorum]
MAEQPRADDDEPTALPEVTVPPWLRSGPAPGAPVPAPDAMPAGPGEGRDGTAGTERTAGTDDTAPHRITLGTRTPERSAAEQSPPPRPDDDLSTLPLRGAESQQPTPTPAISADAGATSGRTPPRWGRIAVFAAAGAAVLAGSGVIGYVATRGIVDGAEADAAAATAGSCEPVAEDGRTVGSGPGSLDSPAGAVLAFDHAYYVERSVEKAFDAVSPSSRMSPDRVRTAGVEQVADGTTHCVDATEISPTLLEVTLTELPPDAEPVEIRQRVRVEQNPDGTWGIVSITPAG